MRYNKPGYTAGKVMKSPILSKATIARIDSKVKNECEMLCKIIPSPSIFRVKSTEDLLHLDWKPMTEELQRTAPVLMAILEAAAARGNNKPDSSILCMVGAIILKSRCKHMCKLQMVISSLLYAGHASKKVSSCSHNNYSSY